MNLKQSTPPAAEECLCRPYSSSPKQKGGTIIAENIMDLAAQQAALLDPDKCRPSHCPHPGCSCNRLHVHGRRERHPLQFVVNGEPVPVVEILVFICTKCSATWRVLPAFLARCLWRPWKAVERETLGEHRANDPFVPGSTVARWRARLLQVALLPVQVLAVAGNKLKAIAQNVGLDATREELVLAYAEGLGSLAVLLHRISPGVRIM